MAVPQPALALEPAPGAGPTEKLVASPELFASPPLADPFVDLIADEP